MHRLGYDMNSLLPLRSRLFNIVIHSAPILCAHSLPQQSDIELLVRDNLRTNTEIDVTNALISHFGQDLLEGEEDCKLLELYQNAR